MGLTVNSKRIENYLSELGQIGRNSNGGIDRITFTESELNARSWLKTKLVELGLETIVDEAANIWGKRRGSAPSIPSIGFGSHIDAVPNGGMYDGALGVILALEVMHVLNDKGIQTRHPLELVSFSAEEPNPYGLSTFGSRAVTSKLKKQDIENVVDASGNKLTEVLRAAGGKPESFEEAKRYSDDFSAFLEVHIEQGKRLLSREIPVGIVTGITGIYREEVTITGVANHAGTTLMRDRHDALLAASESILALEKSILSQTDEEVVGTVGQLNVFPNATNIIPGGVTFSLEIRGQTEDKIKSVLNSWETFIKHIKQKRTVSVNRVVKLNQAPVQMNAELVKICAEQAESLNYPSLLLGSMAGHDSAHMADLAPTCMLFVPSIDGKSHCPEEKSLIQDIEKAANVLVNSILYIDEHWN